MKHVTIAALAACAALLAGCGAPSRSQPAPHATSHAGRLPDRSADARLLDAVTAGDYERNMVVSPYGLRRLFGILVEGSRGRTRDEIVKDLRVSDPADVPLPALAGFSDRDGVWIARGLTSAPAFESTVRSGFGADIFHVDFTSPDTGDAINRWVSAATDGQIGRIRPSRQADFLAIDALMYRVTWAHPFDVASTKPGTFRAGSTAVRVPLMHETADLEYLADGEGQYVRLPFTDGNSMLIALPKSGLTRSTLGHAVSVLDRVRSVESVELTLPRFSSRSFVDLVRPLSNIGVTRIFQASADLKPIFGASGHSLTDVYQEGAIDVDERGARMSVVSVVEESLGPRRAPVPFKVDRPFAFVVEDSKSRQILVAGIVARP